MCINGAKENTCIAMGKSFLRTLHLVAELRTRAYKIEPDGS